MSDTETDYTVFLFRSGRVYVREGKHAMPTGIEPPLLTAHTTAKSEIAALGKVLLTYVDRANQPNQHICPPCELPHLGIV